MRLTADKLYLNSILFAILTNFTPFCGEGRAKEVSEFLGNVFNKLAKYEKTGLEPDAIEALQQEHKRLKEAKYDASLDQ